MKASVHVKTDRTPDFRAAIDALRKKRLLIGVPADKSPRNNEPINNATIAYIQEHGAPEANIPARPFLQPTVKARLPNILADLKKAGAAAFDGDVAKIDMIYAKTGQQTADAVRARIVEGIPPPLAEATLERRITRTAAYKKAGPGKKAAMLEDLTGTPLLDTGALMRSITWVIRLVKG